MGHFLTFTFVRLDLPAMVDCLDTDYIQLQEDNVTTPVLGSYCGNAPQPPVDSFGNSVRLLFHSDGNQQDKSGFLIRVNASIEGEMKITPIQFICNTCLSQSAEDTLRAPVE